MRRIAMLWMVGAAVTCTGCYKVVAPGHVGIVVKQSGTDRGVQDFPIQSGRVWYNPVNEAVLTYPTYVQRAIWTIWIYQHSCAVRLIKLK